MEWWLTYSPLVIIGVLTFMMLALSWSAHRG